MNHVASVASQAARAVRRPRLRPPLGDVRHRFLIDEIAAHGRLSVAACAERMQVSRETIRRDLRQLELRGMLRCIYGGAVLQERDASDDRPATERMRLNPQEKAQIARLAAGLIGQARSVFLDASTTALALARHLPRRPGLSVTTNSLDIAALLGRGDGEGEGRGGNGGEVCVTGGTVRPIDNALVGHAAIACVRGQVFDIAFLGAAALDLEHGYMDYGSEECVLRQTLGQHARRCVMLVDGSKFGRTARLRTFALDAVPVLVTDRAPPLAFATRLAAHGVEVLHD